MNKVAFHLNKKRMVKSILWFLVAVVALPIIYFAVAWGLSVMTVARKAPIPSTDTNIDTTHFVYLHTNGVHLDIAINKQDVSNTLLNSVSLKPNSEYLSFGWGDENFYLNTPTWNDLKVSTAVNALFLKSSTLMHVTHYQTPQPDWIEIPVSKTEMTKINEYISDSFKRDDLNKSIAVGTGYTDMDAFYKAKGSYSIFYTCNTWANNGFKYSGLKASVWTPFDFGLINKYKP